MPSYYNISDFAYTVLENPLAIDGTVIYCADGVFTPPALALLSHGRTMADQANGEIIQILESGGDGVYTIARGAVPQVHTVGTWVLGNIFAEHFNTIRDTYMLTATFVARSFGNMAHGIVRTGSPDGTLDFSVYATNPDTPLDFNLSISPGYGFIRIDNDPPIPHAYYSYPIELSDTTVIDTIIPPAPEGVDLYYSIYLDSDAGVHVEESLINTVPVKDTILLCNLTITNAADHIKNVLIGNGGQFNDKRLFF